MSEEANRYRGRILVEAHHYQRPELVARADFVGDSYRMAVEASRSGAEYIVVCGVKFMAESAAILARPDQKVLLPSRDAGCPMADMIDRPSAERALASIRDFTGKDAVPVVYMNSSAEIKSLAGERGGSVCTSGNAKKILSHYLSSGTPVFFIPDYNLGMNTARSLSLPENEIAVVRRNGIITGTGATSDATAAHARLFLWDGFCHVHKAFTVADVSAARRAVPGAKLIVHPECPPEVVALSDAAGSTEEMLRMIDGAPEGSAWIVGTERRFVERMIAQYQNKHILPLKVSACPDMNRIDAKSLDATMEAIYRHIEESSPIPTVDVPAKDRTSAAAALGAMIRITES